MRPFIQIGICLVLIAEVYGTTKHDQSENDLQFVAQSSATKWAEENQRKIQLETLSILETAAPAQSKAETLQFLQRVQNTCKNLKRLDPAPPGYCPYFYDSFTCWTPAPIGNWSTKTCPKYILGMHTPGITIGIQCRGIRNSDDPSSPFIPVWDYVSTNETHFLQLYGMCFENVHRPPPPSSTLTLHMRLAEILRKTQMVGPICYSISLVALAAASLIFLSFRALHCPRNFIHLHLFLAFMMRAIMCLLQYYLFNNGQSMTIDGDVFEDNGQTKFVKPGSHWQCKLLISLWNYSLVASYFWLLVEGLYLHNVVYFFVFRETGIAGYALFGWIAPLLVLVPWIAVKVLVEDHLCWVAYLNLNYFWILRGPIMATIIINFILFINMIRELFLKLKDSHITETRRYRKLARSSVLLVVILGVYYFIISIPMLLLDTDQLTWPLLVCLSIEHIFGSLQGLMVALVYCFMNSEVRTVMSKRWYRWILLRQVSSSTYATSAGSCGRQGSSVAAALTGSLLPRLLSTPIDQDSAQQSPLHVRRSNLFRHKSAGPTSGPKRALSCSTVNPPLNVASSVCAVGGQACQNCRLADTLRKSICQLRSADENEEAEHMESEKDCPNKMETGTASGYSSSNGLGSARSQSICGGARGSLRSRFHQRRRMERGDTIALLRMRSPHTFDIQEFIKDGGGKNKEHSEADREATGWPPASLAEPWTRGRETKRRYSLNSSVVSYLPLSSFPRKTSATTTVANRSVAPLVKGCWHRQSTDAFL